MKNKESITILGVGNILLTDEGVGVHVINQLKEEYDFPPEVQLLDGGTMGMEILSYMRHTEYLLLVDAVNGGEEPGTVYEFPHQQTEDYFTDHISVHEVGMQDILRIRALQDDPLRDAVVIGVEPYSLAIGLEVSDIVQAKMEEIKTRIIGQLRRWQVEVKRRTC